MPRVPTNQSQQQLAPLNLGRPSPAFQRVSADPSSFGSPQARSMQAAGQQASQFAGQAETISLELAEARRKIQAREDAIKRVQDLNAARVEMMSLFEAERAAEGGFTTQDSVGSFNRATAEVATNVLGKHQGSDESRLIFQGMLEEERGRFTVQAANAGLEASRGLMSQQYSEFVGQQAQIVGDDPTALADAIAEVNDRLSTYADAITPDEEVAMSAAAHEQLATAAVDHYIALGRYEDARRVMGEMSGQISPAKGRQFRLQMIAGEAEIAKETARRNGVRQRLEAAGVDTSDKAVALAIEGITLPKTATEPTLADKVAELEAVKSRALGRPYTATEAEINALADIDAPGASGVFGSGATGRSFELMAANAPAFAAGTLGPEGDRLFLAAASIAASPNPITGLPGTLSPDVREALEMRGIDPDLIGEAGAAQNPQQFLGGGTPVAAPQTPVVSEELENSPEVQSGVQDLNKYQQDTRQFEAEGGMMSPGAPAPPRTLFQMSDLLTGPLSGFQAGASRVPIIGDLLGSPEVVTARAFMNTWTRDLVRVLQNNPRYAEGERQAIEQDIQIESRFIDRPAAFRDTLIGVDEALALRAENARATIEDGKVGREERTHAMNVLNGIEKARSILGVPTKVSSREEALQLPSGTLVQVPDGRILVVP